MNYGLRDMHAAHANCVQLQESKVAILASVSTSRRTMLTVYTAGLISVYVRLLKPQSYIHIRDALQQEPYISRSHFTR